MFEEYKLNKVAVIVLQDNDNLFKELQRDNWKIINYQDFLDNLSLWTHGNPSKETLIELLFSEQIPGIKQHILNKRSDYVGIIGQKIKEISNLLIEEYHRINYNVLLIDEKDNKRFLKTPYNRVYLEMK